MPELLMEKLPSGILAPVNEESAEYLDKVKRGEIHGFNVKKKRNPAFLRKFFALLDIGFNAWEPGEISSEYGTPQKTRDTFREYIIIKAGFFTVHTWPSGKIRIEAKSIAFGNMSEEDFAVLYSNAIDVILQDVLVNYKKQDLEYQVQLVLGFA